jgi:hypothetical protein
MGVAYFGLIVHLNPEKVVVFLSLGRWLDPL